MMSWKKNAFSYLIWFLYTVMTGVALFTVTSGICAAAGVEAYMGIVSAAGYAAAVGGIAFGLHRFAVSRASYVEEKKVHLTVLGALLAVALFAVGFLLRLQGTDGAEYSSSVYYEAAKVMEGQSVPQTVHGAVYFYVWLLRGVFLLLGNYAVAGIWVQIVLQMAASLLLFLVVRRFAGLMASLVVLGFCMCAPFMVSSSLALSPQMLYFFLLTVALAFLSAGYRGALNLKVCFFAGVLAALCGYVDILGISLLLVAIGGVFCHRENAASAGRKAAGVLLCAAGGITAFGGCIFLDAVMSGKMVQRVAFAWLSLYRPEGFRLPVSIDVSGSVTENCLLFGIMAFGIFSFWFDKGKERISIAVLAACGIMAVGCLGIFTEEMPGFFFLYLAFVVLAGIGFGQCFHAEPVKQEEAPAAEEKPDWEILMESKEEQQATEQEKTEQSEGTEEKKVQFLENPLPLPKKHVKRVMDYSLSSGQKEDDDFDIPVAEDDDFDI